MNSCTLSFQFDHQVKLHQMNQQIDWPNTINNQLVYTVFYFIMDTFFHLNTFFQEAKQQTFFAFCN